MSAQDDELVRRYREASEQDLARPGAHVRGAVRAHAQMLAAAAHVPAAPATSRAANASRWKISALATVAVLGLTGLLMLQFQRGTPEEQEIAYGPPRAAAPALAQRPVTSPASAPEPEPSSAPTAAATTTAPAAPPSVGRDQVGRRDALPAQKSLAPAAGQYRPLAKTAPAPAPEAAEPAPSPSTAGAISGLPAPAPLAANRSLESPATPAAPAPPPASLTSPQSAENRQRAAVQDVPIAGQAPSPYPAAPAAIAEAARTATPAQQATAAAAARSLAGGNATLRDGFVDPSPGADRASRMSLLNGLREAARTGRTSEVESLIRQGAPVNASDGAGKTALMLAAMNGHSATVRKLLALGANPALLDREGQNAAQQARRQGHIHTADLIDAAP